jgi:hypothetical protein
LVITGQPGAGKSAVLARAALSVEAGHWGPGLAFHARGATVGDFLAALADLTGIDTSASADLLVTSLAGLPGQSPLPVVLDALDEAASDRDRRQIAEALAELAVLPWLRIAVATRTLAVGNPFAPGGLLPVLGVATRDDHNLIDLDSDTYFDLESLRQFAAALLAQNGMDHPGPPGAAWTQYRAQPGIYRRLAAVIAERAGRNFLVAAMAAVPLSTARTVTDPATKRFDPASIPSGVGEALSKYLDRPDQRQERDRELLTALAYARGAGWMTRPGSPSPPPSAMTPGWPILMPCAVLRPLTTCSRPRRPSASPARSPACSTKPSPTSCSPRGTGPATKAPCSTCSSAKSSTPAGRIGTCATTRPNTRPPPVGSISFSRIRST